MGIQTKFQHDVLVKFCKNGICADTTQGTNHYDFNLLTLLVVDEYGEGIPVGWMISNREKKKKDMLVIVEFLKSIKSRGGDLKAEYFMSDDAEQFFNAWQRSFCEKRD